MTTNLPPELASFASLLDAQPEPVRRAFHYCLDLLMVEDGKAQLVATQPGEAGPVLTFETVAGDRFRLSSARRTSLGHDIHFILITG